MPVDELNRDLEFLAGQLPHRGANTENELSAAKYLRERFAEYTPTAELEEFYSPDSYGMLFAMYYLEFLLVALLALWLPWLALAYGAGVFICYLAEFTGYRVMSRFMPQYATQNVVARLYGIRPRKLFVVTAHYDSEKTTPLSNPKVAPWLRAAHYAVVVAMLIVIATCAADMFGVFSAMAFPVTTVVRWLALAYLIFAAGVLFFSDLSGEFGRGALNNASGVAVLLQLAERFAITPLDDADIWLVATGSKGSWMSGMRHFMREHEFDSHTTYFLNIEHVGAGALRYLTGEGMLHFFKSAPEMVKTANKIGMAFGATPLKLRGLPTDGLIPLTRGFKALGICATGHDGRLAHWNTDADRLTNVDLRVIKEATAFAETMLRELARD